MSEVRTVRLGGRAAAVAWIEGEEPAVVVLHGAGGNHDTLARLAGALGALHIAVRAPSLPGRCGSDGPAPATVAEAAGWLSELVARLDLSRPPLVLGHSFGGGVALELALRHPGRAAAIVLVATGARLRVHPTILATMEHAAATGIPADVGRLPWRPDTDPAVIEEAVAIDRRTPPVTTLADWRAADRFDRLSDLTRVEIPALIVGGAEDPLTPPKYAHFLADHIPRAERVLLAGSGHMLPVEQPERVATAVAAFRAKLL